jgi:alkylation response protein AidB-like acyl-CoA dehydrogenase
MNFGFTEEQELLRAEVRKFLDGNCPLAEVRKIADGELGHSPALWKQIAELGWLGLTIPESYGGAGLGFVDLVVLLEETGRSLFPSPLLAHTLAVDAIRRGGSDTQQACWLPALADGTTIASIALGEAGGVPGVSGIRLEGRAEQGGWVLDGEKLFVPDVAVAGLFIVAFRTAAGARLALVRADAPGVHVEAFPGIDRTKRVGRLRLEGVRVEPEGVLERGGEETVASLFDAGATAMAAESVGAAEAALALTVSYAGERIQFGKPIGQFQGVKHPLAEAYVDIESFKSLVYYAAWCLDESHEDAALAASRAKAYASEAFPRIGIEVVQLHGGIGYTWEYDAHLFLKRAKWMRPAFGDADHHYERVATLGGL